mmetsp:Transcript_16746/g.36985  ORF Transcript_16746/g.36985 Transcript_16746/m.36985 type:complete len:84 (-) Transcript_16746:397-648(-)
MVPVETRGLEKVDRHLPLPLARPVRTHWFWLWGGMKQAVLTVLAALADASVLLDHGGPLVQICRPTPAAQSSAVAQIEMSDML